MTIDHSQWATPRTFVHTFTTGRSAELRETLPVSELVRTGAYTDAVEQLSRWVGGLTPADTPPPTPVLVEAQDIVVEAMLVDPRVARIPTEESVLPIGVLEESEVEEVVMLAFGGRERLDAFRSARSTARPDRAPDGHAPVDAPADEQPRRPARRPGRARAGARG